MPYTKSARKSSARRQWNDLRALTCFTKGAHYFLAVFLALAGHLAHEHLLVSHFPVLQPHDLQEEHDVPHFPEEASVLQHELLFLCALAVDEVVPSTFLSAQQLLFLLLSVLSAFCLTQAAVFVLQQLALCAKACEP